MVSSVIRLAAGLAAIAGRALYEGTMDFNTLQLGLIAQLERGQISVKDAQHRLEEFWIGGLRKAAIEGAEPMTDNGYKVDLVTTLVRRTVASLA